MKKVLCIRGTFLGLLVVFVIGLLPPGPYAGEKSPYGGTGNRGYGEKRPVKSLKEAEKALSDYFAEKGYSVGKVEEKEYFFEAEILDGGKLVDKVIIDKRTGRIRSIY